MGVTSLECTPASGTTFALGDTTVTCTATDAAGNQAEAEVQLPSPLAGFLSHATLEAGDNQAEAGTDALQLMTVHAAKGLEFSAVFIIGLDDGIMPHSRSFDEPEQMEEERRLFYVGITRAQASLTVTWCERRKQGREWMPREPSRFIAEMARDRLAVAPDTPGFGLSTAPIDDPSIDDYARCIADLLAHLEQRFGCRQFDVMGYHTGSKIALALARREAARRRALRPRRARRSAGDQEHRYRR